MFSRSARPVAGALAGIAASWWLTPAYPHAICGDRIFPATLFFLDDIFPNTLGKPIFTGGL
jgi:hypothetical protein